MNKLTINCDGGSRGNPGPAAIGAVVFNETGEELIRLKRTIGVTTNNQAEYQAVVMALEWIKENYCTAVVHARLDSELVVKQLKGEYRIKNQELRPLIEHVHQLVRNIGGQVIFEHVRREENKIADLLVNQALDEAGSAVK